MFFISDDVEWSCNSPLFFSIAEAFAKKLDLNDPVIAEAFEVADVFKFVKLDGLDAAHYKTVLAAAKNVQHAWDLAGGIPGCQLSTEILIILRELIDLMSSDPRAN